MPFNLSMGEITLVLVLALVFLGPKKLPELAAGLGKMIRELKKATAGVKDEIQLEEHVRRPFDELKEAINLSGDELRRRDRWKTEWEQRQKEYAESDKQDGDSGSEASGDHDADHGQSDDDDGHGRSLSEDDYDHDADGNPIVPGNADTVAAPPVSATGGSAAKPNLSTPPAPTGAEAPVKGPAGGTQTLTADAGARGHGASPPTGIEKSASKTAPTKATGNQTAAYNGLPKPPGQAPAGTVASRATARPKPSQTPAAPGGTVGPIGATSPGARRPTPPPPPPAARKASLPSGPNRVGADDKTIATPLADIGAAHRKAAPGPSTDRPSKTASAPDGEAADSQSTTSDKTS